MSYTVRLKQGERWYEVLVFSPVEAIEIKNNEDNTHAPQRVWTAPAPKKRVHPQRFTVTDHVAMAFEREDGGVDVYRYPVSGAGPDAWAEVRFPATYA